MFLLAEADSLAEKIPRLEYYPSGGIILAQGLDFQTARGSRAFGGVKAVENLKIWLNHIAPVVVKIFESL